MATKVVDKVVDKFIDAAVASGAPKWIAKQGMELWNLIDSGFLSPESVANKGQVTRAKNLYVQALGNRSFRGAQAAKLKSDGTVKTVRDVGERPIVTPESMQGRILTPVSGDKTVVGQTVEEMFGYSVDGVPVDGGPMFGLSMKDKVVDPQNELTRLGWASMEDAANKKQAGFDWIANKTGNDDISGVYTPMTDISMDFASPLSEITGRITQQLSGIPKKVIKQFDSAIRDGSGKKVSKEGKVSYTRDPQPDWVGIEHPDAVAQLTGSGDYPKSGAGALRKVYMAVSASKGNPKQGHMDFRQYGVPNRDSIVKEITEKELQAGDKGTAGFSIFDAVAGADTVPFGSNKFNQSYDTGIEGYNPRGHEVFNIPPEVYFPDMMEYLSKKTNSSGVPFSRDQQIGSFMMNPNIYQKADQKWLDGVMGYTEKALKQAEATGKPIVAGGLLGAAGMSNASEVPLDQLYSPESISLLSSIPSQADIDGSTITAMPQSYSSQMANAMTERMDGNQASRNRRAQSFGGILDFTPVGGADSMREGKRLREDGQVLEGLLNSAIGAFEFVPFVGQGISKGVRGAKGLLGY